MHVQFQGHVYNAATRRASCIKVAKLRTGLTNSAGAGTQRTCVSVRVEHTLFEFLFLRLGCSTPDLFCNDISSQRAGLECAHNERVDPVPG